MLLVRFFIWVCTIYARWKGWEFIGEIPSGIKKCVIIVAPHTSAWDFIIGMAGFQHYQYPFRYFAKMELFKFPLKLVLHHTGAIPVNRFKKHDLVKDTIEHFKKEEEIYLVLSPEGTRAYTEKWRTGFYQISLGARVPLFLGYLDYKKKEAGISEAISLTGEKEKDYEKIRAFYKDVTPYNAEKWCPDFT